MEEGSFVWLGRGFWVIARAIFVSVMAAAALRFVNFFAATHKGVEGPICAAKCHEGSVLGYMVGLSWKRWVLWFEEEIVQGMVNRLVFDLSTGSLGDLCV